MFGPPECGIWADAGARFMACQCRHAKKEGFGPLNAEKICGNELACAFHVSGEIRQFQFIAMTLVMAVTSH